MEPGDDEAEIDEFGLNEEGRLDLFGQDEIPPFTEATASADGYSHSYRTNAIGNVTIYLDGPPPGAQITVTIGGATCHTSD